MPDKQEIIEQLNRLQEKFDEYVERSEENARIQDFLHRHDRTEAEIKHLEDKLVLIDRAMKTHGENRELLEESIELRQQIVERNAHITELHIESKKSAKNPEAEKALSELADTIFTRKSREVESGTIADYRNSMSTFFELIGDKPAHIYQKSDVDKFAHMLLEVPKNLTQISAKLGTKDKLEAIRLNKELKTPFPTISVATIRDKYLTNIRMMFETLVAMGILESNPAKDVKITSRPDEDEDKSRYPFGPEQLDVIFNAPIYTTGVRSARHRHTPGNFQLRNRFYWAPLIALFTGMRISEIGQLLLLDIFELHGVPHFNVTNTYSRRRCEIMGISYQLTSNIKKKIKRKASRRFIPVHSELIKIGFLEYVEQQKSRKGSQLTNQLFPDWKPDYKGSYSGTFKYGRTLEVLGIKEKGCTHFAFHSFRHSFMDALRNADVAQNTADKLFGHAQNKVSSEYGSDYITAEQSAKIEMVKYNGLDLSHLHPFKY